MIWIRCEANEYNNNRHKFYEEVYVGADTVSMLTETMITDHNTARQLIGTITLGSARCINAWCRSASARRHIGAPLVLEASSCASNYFLTDAFRYSVSNVKVLFPIWIAAAINRQAWILLYMQVDQPRTSGSFRPATSQHGLISTIWFFPPGARANQPMELNMLADSSHNMEKPWLMEL